MRLMIILLLGIILMAFMDIIVLEKIYHPLSSQFDIPWSAYYVSEAIDYIWWWVAFIPMGFIMFGLLGWAARSWKLVFGGAILFLTGWEDMFYYVLRGTWFSGEMAWLNTNPVMALLNLFTPGPNVTSTTVTIAVIIGGLFVWSMFNWDRVGPKYFGVKKERRKRERRKGDRRKSGRRKRVRKI